MAKSFEDLEIWKLSHKLTLLLYKETENWPSVEKYNLTSQIKRACVSTELLIAEGHSRYHNKDIIRFMIDARASAEEVRNCLMLARDLPLIQLDRQKFMNFNLSYLELIKRINSFIRSLRADSLIR